MFSFDMMEHAINQAIKAQEIGEVPVGAVIARKREIVAIAHNMVLSKQDPTAHAEILAIREAGLRCSTHILDDCEIYVTLEPCPMCMHAIFLARIKKIFFGAYDQKCVTISEDVYKDFTIIGGIKEDKCSCLLKSFFSDKRS